MYLGVKGKRKRKEIKKKLFYSFILENYKLIINTSV